MKFVNIFILAISISFLCACTSLKKTYITENDKNGLHQKLPEEGKVETLFLIGDTGTDKNYEDVQLYLFKHLKHALKISGDKTSIVFLGDNIYPAGLPKETDANRKKAEKKLNTQLELLKELTCEAYFIPGNHDWNRMSAGGLEAVKRQEKYIENYDTEKEIQFYPNEGCGDPIVEKITEDLYYVFIDTQWWLQNWKRESDINEGCEIQSRQEFLETLQTIFDELRNNQIVVMMHHPLFSNGEHGGNFPIADHFFPFRILNPKLWIPLPVFGSLLPLLRSAGAVKQDIPNAKYQQLKNGILDMLIENQHVIFAAGHDHSLQYFEQNQHHYIISGAGSKTDFVRVGGEARMVSDAMGYSAVHFYKDGTAWLDFYTADKNQPQGKLIYRKKIIGLK